MYGKEAEDERSQVKRFLKREIGGFLLRSCDVFGVSREHRREAEIPTSLSPVVWVSAVEEI